MYILKIFEITDESVIEQFIKENGFATILQNDCRKRSKEFIFHMSLDITLIKMFQIFKSSVCSQPKGEICCKR